VPEKPTDDAPVLVWFRRDLRLDDHPALSAACASGRPVVPVFLLDEVVEGQGACPKWRLGLAVEAFAARLAERGARLILRRGRADRAIVELAARTGATAVFRTRAHDPEDRARDAAVDAALRARGVACRDFDGHVLHEPDRVATEQGGYYKVYSPYWRAVSRLDVPAPLPAPRALHAPASWPQSDRLADWNLGGAMNRGAPVVARHVTVGEAAAVRRLERFVECGIDGYAAARDDLGAEGTSGLSENLTYGEISIRRCWHAALRAREEGRGGAEAFLRELVWRDFAYHLMWHTPHLTNRNWREGWADFPWSRDAGSEVAQAWMRGRTGIDLVDAAMREMFVTGRMHNRARMIAASYLTKHLLTHWRVGQDWFAECLADWDPASNALGWQWVAGSGPDAAPFFRVFNPDTQREKFDPDRRYIDRWIAEERADPSPEALSYFDAIPRRWRMSAGDPRPAPAVALRDGRERALSAYRTLREA